MTGKQAVPLHLHFPSFFPILTLSGTLLVRFGQIFVPRESIYRPVNVINTLSLSRQSTLSATIEMSTWYGGF